MNAKIILIMILKMFFYFRSVAGNYFVNFHQTTIAREFGKFNQKS